MRLLPAVRPPVVHQQVRLIPEVTAVAGTAISVPAAEVVVRQALLGPAARELAVLFGILAAVVAVPAAVRPASLKARAETMMREPGRGVFRVGQGPVL